MFIGLDRITQTREQLRFLIYRFVVLIGLSEFAITLVCVELFVLNGA